MLFPIILDVITITKPWDHSIEVPITSEVITLEVREEVDVETIEQMIIRYAKENGVDQKLALNIARCESGFDPNARNKNSTAGGLYQFLDKTWVSNSKYYGRTGESKYDVDANIDVATKKLAREGTNARKASENCRNK